MARDQAAKARPTPGHGRLRRLVALDVAALLVLAGLTGFLAFVGRTNQARIHDVERRGVAASVYSEAGRLLERQHMRFVRFEAAPSRALRDAFLADLIAMQRLGDRHAAAPFRDLADEEAREVAGPFAAYARSALTAMDARLGGSPEAGAAAREAAGRYASLRDFLDERRIRAEDAAARAVVALDSSGGFVALWAPLIAALAAVSLVAISARSRRTLRRNARLEAERETADERERLLQRAYEEQREAARLAAEASRMKDNLVSTVSHEFRSPLTSIRGYANILRWKAETLDDERRREFLETIEEQAERLTGMVDNLLTLSGLAHRPVFDGDDDGPARLSEVAAPVVHEFALRGTHRVEMALERDVTVDAGSSTLAHVLGNLLDNAAKYSPPGSSIRVVIGLDGDMARLAVHDQGTGVPPEHLERIFEPFWRPPGQSQDGSGLGLAIARELTASLGGRIEVSSAPGRGACFTVLLPAAGSSGGADGAPGEPRRTEIA